MAVNLLVSYAFHAESDLAALRRDLVCGLLMVDSGAFTAWSKGQTISLDEYARYLEMWRGCWDHAITLDVVGDTAATAANTRRLHERGLPVMPVFTRGSTLADFDAMVADVGYVCVGGLVGTPRPAQRARVAMLQRRAAEQGGGIHALGVGSVPTLRGARPYSADASGISGTFRFGTLAYFTGTHVAVVPLHNTKRLRREWKHIRAHGIDLATLARTGRMPAKEGRAALMRSMSLAYAVADEQLRDMGPVDPPRGSRAHGTLLYNSMITQGYAAQVARLDRSVHAGTHLFQSTPPGDTPAVTALDAEVHQPDVPIPPIWRWYAPHHHTRCRAQPAPEIDHEKETAHAP